MATSVNRKNGCVYILFKRGMCFDLERARLAQTKEGNEKRHTLVKQESLTR